MDVVFVSNYINHHQIPVSTVLFNRCKEEKGSYYFIQTEPMEEERVNMGWGQTLQVPDFVLYYWECEEECRNKILNADVVIFGGSDDESYIEERLRQKKPVWRYSERIYKSGRWKFISPRGLKKKFHDHTRHSFERVYLLCSGAYVAGDFRMVMAYGGKKYQYGYFPQKKEYDIQKLLLNKGEKIKLLWAARMITWKHPETALTIASDLKKNGYDFQLIMLGDGERMPFVKELLKTLDIEDRVELKGFCNPQETRKYMEESHIYLATSDRLEGWGAVINEAMNSGMAVIANRDMGAAKSMIEDGKNGVLYKGSNPSGLWKKVAELIENGEIRSNMGKAAYETIETTWNAQVAANRLYDCMKAELSGKDIPQYEKGPLSRDRLFGK